jgi:hypothetical protein
MQYEVIATRNYLKLIFTDPNIKTNAYHLCGSASETVQNVIAPRPKLARNTYKRLHDYYGGDQSLPSGNGGRTSSS